MAVMEVAALLGVLFIGVLIALGTAGFNELRRVVRGDHVVVDVRPPAERHPRGH